MAEAYRCLFAARLSAPAFRLACLAWLVQRGLRRTAGCSSCTLEEVRLVAAAAGRAVEFELRPAAEAERDCYDLGDRVVLYAAGTRQELKPVWQGHREGYDCQWALGRALGYLTPQTAEREAGRPIIILAGDPAGDPAGDLAGDLAGGGVELWKELVLPSAGEGEVAAYVARLEAALAEVGVRAWARQV